jgi:F-type H+-transporting ATPase subunit a
VLWTSFAALLTRLPLADAGGPLWLLPKIDVKPSTLFTIFGFPITNTLLDAWASMIIVLAIFIGATRKMKIVPKGLQNFIEWISGLLLDFCEDVVGKEWARRLFPFIATIFFYVLFCNWLEIFPGVDSLGTPDPGAKLTAGFLLLGDQSDKFTPWLRPASSDLNFTLALALISVIVTQAYGFRTLGFFKHVGKYLVNPFRNPMGTFVGVLEIISELARIISFSFRLFGNVFAGDVLLIVLGTLLPFIGPTLFYPLELFVGFIQAFVFAALTLVFISLAISTHDEDAHEAALAH